MMNIFEINKRIGQRPPFQMIEKVLELEPNVSARGIKNVSINETRLGITEFIALYRANICIKKRNTNLNL